MVERFNGILNLSSNDKRIDEDNRNVKFYLPVPDYEGDAIGLSGYNIFYGIDNINNNNNISVFETAVQSYPVTIPNGNYTYENLRSEIQTQLNTLGLGAFTVVLFNNRYRITSPVPIKFVTNPVSGYKYDWASMISLPKDNNLSLVVNGSTTDLLYTNKLLIVSGKLHSSKTTGDYLTGPNNIGNILGIVYLNSQTESQSAILDYANIKWVFKRTSQNIFETDIQILDGQGLNIPRETDLSGTVLWDLQIRIRSLQ